MLEYVGNVVPAGAVIVKVVEPAVMACPWRSMPYVTPVAPTEVELSVRPASP